jgi:hypothetical protein
VSVTSEPPPGTGQVDGLAAWLDTRDPAGHRPKGPRTTIRGHRPDYDVGRPFRTAEYRGALPI